MHCINSIPVGEGTDKRGKVKWLGLQQYVCVVCVCVFFPFILDIKFVGRSIYIYIYVWSSVWINRVTLPILLVVS